MGIIVGPGLGLAASSDKTIIPERYSARLNPSTLNPQPFKTIIIMKAIKIFLAAIFLASGVTATAQVVKKADADRKKKEDAGVQVTDRQQSFYEVKEISDADLEWMKIVYRQLDLTVGRNPALYYPEMPNADGQNLFFIIMRLLADGKIKAYEFLDGRELFTPEFEIKVGDMLDNQHIMYTEAKGSTEKSPRYTIEDSDIPSNEVLSYYIIEKWEFDRRSNRTRTSVEALCPVAHRMDDYGGEALRYPMFWVKLNDIRPYLAQQYVFTDDDNNLPRYNLDDFFKLGLYTGEIYKTKNMRNLTLMQQFPEDAALKHAQDSIEYRLQSFNTDLWVPAREQLQAMRDAKNKEAVDADGDGEPDEKVDGESADKKKEEATPRTTKRGADKKSNVKQRKPKQVKAKAAASRSVRNRKR